MRSESMEEAFEHYYLKYFTNYTLVLVYTGKREGLIYAKEKDTLSF